MSSNFWQPVFVGIGSNLDNPVEHVSRALQELEALSLSSLELVSGLYESDPVGPAGQPDYINAVAGLLTRHSPLELLDSLQAIEQSHDRDRTGERWSARTLDLDILAYSQLEMRTERLTLPHVELHRRDFVLGPWMEIAPDFNVVGLGSVRKLARCVDLGTLRFIRD
ncbi:MAG: 2-amino-4-hydroxy-6-hydroxymethyldihydropteridine diphosphokinase [Gammaproteobacteria bacterium]